MTLAELMAARKPQPKPKPQPLPEWRRRGSFNRDLTGVAS